MLLEETVFLTIEKPFFLSIRYSRQLKQFLLRGKFFLTNSSIPPVETNFLFSRKSIVLFRALLKILKFGGGKLFKRNLSFWPVEVNFFHFSDNPASERYFLSEKDFDLVPVERDFLPSGN